MKKNDENIEYDEPLWFDEIVPKADREMVFEQIQGMNSAKLRDYFLYNYEDEIWTYLLNWLEFEHEEPYEVDHDLIPRELLASRDRAKALLIIFFACHLQSLVIDDDDLKISDRVIEYLYFQLDWLEDEYDEFPALPQYRWSTDYIEWNIRPVSELVQLSNGVWITRETYERHYQPRLGGF